MCSYTSSACCVGENCARLKKNFCESLIDRLLVYVARGWCDYASGSLFHCVTFQYLCCDSQILQAPIRRGSDERLVNGCAFKIADRLYFVYVAWLGDFGLKLVKLDIVLVEIL